MGHLISILTSIMSKAGAREEYRNKAIAYDASFQIQTQILSQSLYSRTS